MKDWIYVEEEYEEGDPEPLLTLVIHFDTDWQTFELHASTSQTVRLGGIDASDIASLNLPRKQKGSA